MAPTFGAGGLGGSGPALLGEEPCYACSTGWGVGLEQPCALYDLSPFSRTHYRCRGPVPGGPVRRGGPIGHGAFDQLSICVSVSVEPATGVNVLPIGSVCRTMTFLGPSPLTEELAPLPAVQCVPLPVLYSQLVPPSGSCDSALRDGTR